MHSDKCEEENRSVGTCIKSDTGLSKSTFFNQKILLEAVSYAIDLLCGGNKTQTYTHTHHSIQIWT